MTSESWWGFSEVSKVGNTNIALRIKAVFGGNAHPWLRMQRGYDLIEEKNRFELNPPNLKPFLKVW